MGQYTYLILHVDVCIYTRDSQRIALSMLFGLFRCGFLFRRYCTINHSHVHGSGCPWQAGLYTAIVLAAPPHFSRTTCVVNSDKLALIGQCIESVRLLWLVTSDELCREHTEEN